MEQTDPKFGPVRGVPQWAKVVAECLALIVGASAPPLILFGLNPPFPGSRESRYASKPDPAHAHIDGEAAQHNTPPPPPSLPRQQSPNLNAISPQPQYKGDAESGAEWWVALWTFCLFIATTGLWFFTGLMWLATRRAVSEGQQAIAAAQRSAVAMEGVAAAMTQNVANTRALMDNQRRYAQMQMRAYLSVVVGAAIYQETAKGILFEAKPVVVNTGNTPAHNVTQNLRAEILSMPLAAGFTFPLLPQQQAQGGAVINPRQDRLLSAIVDQFVLDPDVPLIKQGIGRALTVWGTIRYTDVFGDPHTTNFSQILTWLADDRVLGHYPAEHNNSD